MLSNLSAQLAALASFAAIAHAQQSLYGQCGGIGQCLPGAGPTTLKTSTTSKPATSSSTSIKSTTTVAPPPKSSSTSSSAKASSTVPASPPSSSAITNLITFGDSYSQTGYVYSAGLPSAANPLGNPAFPGYTTTGGANWIGDLVSTYKPTGRTLLSYNFAYGGATVNATLVAPYESTVESLIDQVNLFKQNLVPSSLWTGANTLFGVWIGVNDVGNGWSTSNWNTLYPEIVRQYLAQVQVLYNAGGRQFLLLTVPPTQRSPMVLAEGTSTENAWGAAILQFNAAIQSSVSAFQKANPAATVYVYDTQVPFNTALDNPTAYGAPNNSCFDAGGSICLWWNNYHPGLAIQNLVAKGVAALTGI
ncbi:hypothetical protein MMC25_007252 [Agyrium rufum]|nr:hypothetical protein [Agyrium rufum]